MLDFAELVGLVAINAVIDTLIVLVFGVRRWKAQVATMWNERVELKDMDGSVIKIPVSRKVVKDGKEEIVTTHEVGPLWLTVAYGLGTFAADRLKFSLMSAKGKGARFLNSLATDEALEGMDPKTAELVELAGALGGEKWRKRAALALKLRGRVGTQGNDAQKPSEGYKV